MPNNLITEKLRAEHRRLVNEKMEISDAIKQGKERIKTIDARIHWLREQLINSVNHKKEGQTNR